MFTGPYRVVKIDPLGNGAHPRGELIQRNDLPDIERHEPVAAAARVGWIGPVLVAVKCAAGKERREQAVDQGEAVALVLGDGQKAAPQRPRSRVGCGVAVLVKGPAERNWLAATLVESQPAAGDDTEGHIEKDQPVPPKRVRSSYAASAAASSRAAVSRRCSTSSV